MDLADERAKEAAAEAQLLRSATEASDVAYRDASAGREVGESKVRAAEKTLVQVTADLRAAQEAMRASSETRRPPHLPWRPRRDRCGAHANG